MTRDGVVVFYLFFWRVSVYLCFLFNFICRFTVSTLLRERSEHGTILVEALPELLSVAEPTVCLQIGNFLGTQ